MKAKITDIYYNPNSIIGKGVLKEWAGNLYAKITKRMRMYPVDVQYNEMPYVFNFAQTLIRYFMENGLTKSQLVTKGRRLFRGTHKLIIDNDRIIDDSFISTSLSKYIADGFSSKYEDGTVIMFKTGELPDTMYVSIDETIDPIFHEKEILMLPGVMTIIDKNYLSTYNVNDALVQEYLSRPSVSLQEITGGSINRMTGMLSRDKDYIDRVLGKIALFYRAIEGKPVEILWSSRLSENREEVIHYFRKKLRPLIHQFEAMTDFIPDVRELRAYIKDPANRNKTKTRNKKIERMFSYYPTVLVYDPNKNEVSHIGDIPHEIHLECGDKTHTTPVLTAIYEYFQKDPSMLTYTHPILGK